MVHKLLALENPNNGKLQMAWHRMHTDKKHKNEISSEEYSILKKQLSEYKKILYSGSKSNFYGHGPRKHTQESKNKISEHCKGRKRSKESIEKMVRKRKEKGNYKWTDSQKKKMSISKKGKSPSLETKKKIGDASRGRKMSSDTKKKLSISHLGKNSRKVICIETNKVFSSIREASEWCSGNVGKACSGKRKRAGGYT